MPTAAPHRADRDVCAMGESHQPKLGQLDPCSGESCGLAEEVSICIDEEFAWIVVAVGWLSGGGGGGQMELGEIPGELSAISAFAGSGDAGTVAAIDACYSAEG